VQRPVLACIALVGSVGWFGACGQGDEATSIAAVKKCLEEEGLDVRAAKAEPDDDDAPDRGELIATGRRGRDARARSGGSPVMA
jgi:hypothetical protein